MILWSDQCAERARLRHPLMNVLLDYGAADRERTFEAYSIGEPIRVSGPGGVAVTAARRAFHGIARPPAVCATSLISRCATSSSARSGWPRLLEPAEGLPNTGAAGVRLSSGRALGLILQPRAILESLSEALEVAAPGGTTGDRDCRRTRVRDSHDAAAGRADGARWQGSSRSRARSSFAFRGCAKCLAGRHLCVLLDDHSLGERAPCSRCSWLDSESPARGGTFCSDSPELKRRVPGARWIDTMGIAAMTSMVFVDGDNGPSHEELFDAARGASGRPGLFLERLRATQIGEHAARIALVHESSPAYVFRRRHPGPNRAASAACCAMRRDRGARLAARGRHASAVRLLARASRVLEARGETALAAACAERLAWIHRDRGQSRSGARTVRAGTVARRTRSASFRARARSP